MKLPIHLAQIEPTLGNLETNLALHREAIQAAVERDAAAVVFPELSLTGYFLKDQTSEVALRLDSERLAGLREASREISVGVGLVEEARDGRRYNSYVWFEDGELLHAHRKVHLVAYGIFEESRDLAAGEAFTCFESKHGRLGILICEDMWHVGGPLLYFMHGVDALIVPSASPARGVAAEHEGLGSSRTWNSILEASSTLFQCWILYINRVGCEDGISFGGGTRAFDPDGARVDILEGLEPGRLELVLDTRASARARMRTPLRRDEKPWILLRELQRLEEERS